MTWSGSSARGFPAGVTAGADGAAGAEGTTGVGVTAGTVGGTTGETDGAGEVISWRGETGEATGETGVIGAGGALFRALTISETGRSFWGVTGFWFWLSMCSMIKE